eukprot:3278885-Rhodomonas_salina.2
MLLWPCCAFGARTVACEIKHENHNRSTLCTETAGCAFDFARSHAPAVRRPVDAHAVARRCGRPEQVAPALVLSQVARACCEGWGVQHSFLLACPKLAHRLGSRVQGPGSRVQGPGSR